MSRKEDPHRPTPFNPLEKRRLAQSIVRELIEGPSHPLPPPEQFLGAGIYAIYYRGGFPLYDPISELNRETPTHPIYVGRAISPGGRKGGFTDETVVSPALMSRLGQHAASVRQASNLDLADFECRYLVVDEFWIGLAESMLIETYQPVWNVVLDGFGNHDPGAGRRQGRRPNWDTLHPGRTWAEQLQPSPLTLPQIEELVRSHYARTSELKGR